MKIFDTVTFFQENHIMDLRFNILNEYIDKFIVCEGIEDHQGNKKEINFNINNFKKFKNKIVHIVCEPFPKHINAWERQAIQREKILNGIKNITKEDDLILYSDPDEIPDPKILKKIKETSLNEKYIIFLQKLYFYKFNLQTNDLLCNWEGTKGCLKKNLKSIDFMRHKVKKKNINYNIFRFDKEKSIQVIDNAGWHFSYLLTPEQIQRKIKTFAHTEFNHDQFYNLKNINDSVKNGVDLFGRNMKFKKVNLDNSYPEYILNNQDKYKQWIV